MGFIIFIIFIFYTAWDIFQVSKIQNNYTAWGVLLSPGVIFAYTAWGFIVYPAIILAYASRFNLASGIVFYVFLVFPGAVFVLCIILFFSFFSPFPCGRCALCCVRGKPASECSAARLAAACNLFLSFPLSFSFAGCGCWPALGYAVLCVVLAVLHSQTVILCAFVFVF